MPIYRNKITGKLVEVMPGTKMSKAYEQVLNDKSIGTTQEDEKDSKQEKVTPQIPKQAKAAKKSPKKAVLEKKSRRSAREIGQTNPVKRENEEIRCTGESEE